MLYAAYNDGARLVQVHEHAPVIDANPVPVLGRLHMLQVTMARLCKEHYSLHYPRRNLLV